MSARRTFVSSEFALEALEARALLSGIPSPDPSQVTLLNGQHPVADASFLNPADEDWTVAQPGHDSGPPPTLNDADMYDFPGVAPLAANQDDLSWADHWDPITDAELGNLDDGGPVDFSGASGLPAAATHHLYPSDPPAMLAQPANAPQPLAATVPPADASVPVAPAVGAPAPVIPVPALRMADTAPASAFVESASARGSFDPDAPLYTFGSKAKSSFLSTKATRKPSSVVASFVDSSASDQPLSSDLIDLPTIL